MSRVIVSWHVPCGMVQPLPHDLQLLCLDLSGPKHSVCVWLCLANLCLAAFGLCLGLCFAPSPSADFFLGPICVWLCFGCVLVCIEFVLIRFACDPVCLGCVCLSFVAFWVCGAGRSRSQCLDTQLCFSVRPCVSSVFGLCLE